MGAYVVCYSLSETLNPDPNEVSEAAWVTVDDFCAGSPDQAAIIIRAIADAGLGQRVARASALARAGNVTAAADAVRDMPHVLGGFNVDLVHKRFPATFANTFYHALPQPAFDDAVSQCRGAPSRAADRIGLLPADGVSLRGSHGHHELASTARQQASTPARGCHASPVFLAAGARVTTLLRAGEAATRVQGARAPAGTHAAVALATAAAATDVRGTPSSSPAHCNQTRSVPAGLQVTPLRGGGRGRLAFGAGVALIVAVAFASGYVVGRSGPLNRT